MSNVGEHCDSTIYKHCKQCKQGFVDNLWCGELACQRCLDMCWIVDDREIIDRVLSCCDYHRPLIKLNNMQMEKTEMHIFDKHFTDTQNKKIDDINDRIQSIEDRQFDFDELQIYDNNTSSSPIIKEVAGKIKNYFVNMIKTEKQSF